MKFLPAKQISKAEAEEALGSMDVEEISQALTSISNYESDWNWAQETLLIFLEHSNPEISGLAATCLGHLARVHRQIDKDKIVGRLRSHLYDSEISGRVSDALDDIEIFL